MRKPKKGIKEEVKVEYRKHVNISFEELYRHDLDTRCDSTLKTVGESY